MSYYCARLLVVCLVNFRKPRKRNLYDYPFVVFRAVSYSSAFKVALKLGKAQETRYEGSKKGESVRWAFVRVEEIKRRQKLKWSRGGLDIGQAADEQSDSVWKAVSPRTFKALFVVSANIRPLAELINSAEPALPLFASGWRRLVGPTISSRRQTPGAMFLSSFLGTGRRPRELLHAL